MKNNTIAQCAVISRRRSCLSHFIRNFFSPSAESLKQLSCLIASCFCLLSASAQAPVITDFSPLSSPLNGTVTVTGNNFSTDTDGNAVYIGGSRARVLTASTTSLKVQVLPGATSDILRITTNGLTGYSKKRFTVTFPSPEEFSPGSFSSGSTIDQSSSNTAFGDIDGDGKQDMVVVHTRTLRPYASDLVTIAVNKNTSSVGNISFDLSETLRLPDTYKYSVYLNDLNSDGKLDLVVSPLNKPFLYYYKNNSTLENINFDAAKIINVAEPLKLIRFVDIDGDGKEDLIMTDEGVVKFLLNTGTGDDIRYAAPYTIYLQRYFSASAFGDLDGDGKMDVIMSGINGSASNASVVGVMRNTGTRGNLSFDYFHLIPTGLKRACKAQIADIDLDGKPDIIAFEAVNDTISVLKNKITTPGVFTFDNPIKISVAYIDDFGPKLQDLDGDGRLDIVSFTRHIEIARNTSTTSQISFEKKLKLNGTNILSMIDIKDMDGDGRSDLLLALLQRGTYIQRNQMLLTLTNPSITSFLPSKAQTDDTVVINGNNFFGTTNVLFGDSAARSFSVVSNNKILAVVGPGASGAITVKAKNGQASITGFTYSKEPSFKLRRYTPDFHCQGEIAGYSAVMKNQPANAYFRMIKNNIRQGEIELYQTSLKEGDQIWAVLYVNGKFVQSSDTVTIGYLQPIIKPTIKISQSKKEVCKGSPVKFTATTTAGIGAPAYQWYKNKTKVGLNQATYTDSLLKTGDSVFCVLNAENQCAIVPVTSNSVGITVYNHAPANPSLIAGPSTANPGEQGIGFSIDPANEVQAYNWLIPSGTMITSGKGTNAIIMNWGNLTGKVSVKLSNPCGSSAVVTKLVTINNTASRLANNSVEKELKLTGFSIYPNPANSSATAEFIGRSDRRYFVQLRDAAGKLLQSQKPAMVKGRIAVTLNTANYLPGVYYVIVTDEFNETVSKRLLIGR